jgi:Na+/proline symporter
MEVKMKFPWYIWIPRVMIILLAAFMALFSLDVFDSQAAFGQKMLGLLIQNIPSLILLLVLLLTWKRPFLGGIIFGVLAVLFVVAIAIYFTKFLIVDTIAFAVPMIIGSLLFFMAYYRMRKTAT